MLSKAKRPMIIAGNGIRLSGTVDEFNKFVDGFNLPVVASYLAIDLMDTSSDKFIGRLGTKGDRAGNFALQNADFVLVLGSRLSVALTGFEYDLFMRDAKVVVIDIDAKEHQKNKIKQLGLERWIPRENIFISSEVGIAKPDIRIFELVQKKLNLVPNTTYYVGDSFDNDILGASNAGWNTVWSNRKNKKNPNSNIHPTFIINEKNSLLKILNNLK